MKLTKVRIGSLIRPCDERNIDNKNLPFYGINKDKKFMPTIADTNNLDGSKYKIMTKGRFVFSGMQTGRDMCLRIGMYEYDFDCLISPAYTTFEVVSERIIPEYLFMLFLSSEMDRYCAFLTDGSIRANLDWDVFCDIKIELPPIEIQKKYVAIYKAMTENQKSYEKGLEDLKITCDAYIENLRRSMPLMKIGQFIEPVDERNSNLEVTLAQGVTNNKIFAAPKQVSQTPTSAKIVRHGHFAYNKATTRNGEKISIAYRNGDDCVVSSAYQVFKIIRPDLLNPEYLMMWFNRSEFDRYARYVSYGSAHEFFTYEDMEEVEIPIPDIKIQDSIVNIYKSYIERNKMCDDLSTLIKSICPVLIKGAIKKGSAS